MKAMQTVNIHEAKTHLSRLIAQAQQGESFCIAKNGTPLVMVTPITVATRSPVRRLGFLRNTMKVPEDFDQMGAPAIEALFAGGSVP